MSADAADDVAGAAGLDWPPRCSCATCPSAVPVVAAWRRRSALVRALYSLVYAL